MNDSTPPEDAVLIERVSRALYEHDASLSSMRWNNWRQCSRQKRLRYEDKARVAIAAIAKEEAHHG